MNYLEINKAILEERDINEKLVTKDDKFYKYLFNNKVAYYYSKCLSKNPNDKEKWIIKEGDELNTKYINTLSIVKNICDKHDISFLLYKTHKYIPEVVDGDIDIFVRKEDFNKLLQVFRKEGFDSIEDESGKGRCFKKGFLLIEPHIGISWRGSSYVSENFIWEHTREISVKDNFHVRSASLEVELISLIGKVYFSPEYLDLYGLKQVRATISQINLESIYKNINFVQSFKYLISITEKDSNFINKKLPLFLDNISYLKTWRKQALLKDFKTYILHCLCFLYWKYRYLFFNKLPFTHIWHEDK